MSLSPTEFRVASGEFGRERTGLPDSRSSFHDEAAEYRDSSRRFRLTSTAKWSGRSPFCPESAGSENNPSPFQDSPSANSPASTPLQDSAEPGSNSSPEPGRSPCPNTSQ